MTTSVTFPLADSAVIREYAAKYWDLISQSAAHEERSFAGEIAIARKRGHFTKSLIVRVAVWKSPRNRKWYELNTGAVVKTVTASALVSDDDRSALDLLTRHLYGVKLRTASAILHWMRPKRFPILDFRVVAALGEAAPRSYEDYEFYSHIADRIRGIAKVHSLSLRIIDRALWSWDKLQSQHHRASRYGICCS